jgi:molybdenum cofactor cytidylyltransferase
MCIRGIILAAGSSKRMGRNKLSMELCGKTILDIVIDNAKKSCLDEVILVYGRYETAANVQKIYNPNYDEGMSTSLIAGMSEFSGDAVMLLLGDMPYVTSEIINRLYEGYTSSDKNIAVPVKNGRRGNPVIIGKRYFSDIMNNRGDKGARNIIRNNAGDIEYIELNNEGIFIDIDDMEKYNEIALNML